MKINNRHVGWGIILLIAVFPFLHQLFTDSWYMFDAYKVLTGFQLTMSAIGWLELIFLGMALITTIVFLICGLLEDEITFEWEIKLPGKKPGQTNEDKQDFLKLGTLNPNSSEWREVYEKLNSKGKFG